MSDAAPQFQIDHYQTALEELAWTIEASVGQFTLLLARCNYQALQVQLADQLQQICAIEIQRITLSAAETTLFSAIRDRLGDRQPQALMVFGLESLQDLGHVLAATNQVREEFRQQFRFPLILWINDAILKQLVRLAPDFESWATTTEFRIAPSDLQAVLHRGAETLFTLLLRGQKPSDYPEQTHAFGWLDRSELPLALQDLQQASVSLDPTLQAILALIQGIDAGIDPAALTYFQQSLQFWQQQQDFARQALILFYIGRYYFWALERQQDPVMDWTKARSPLESCIHLLKQANCLDLMARRVSYLQIVLQRMQAWADLETVTREAIRLHRTYRSPRRLARDYGFLAEVALHNEQWHKARHLAQKALQILATASDAELWERSLHLLRLAQAECQLQQPQAAIGHLVEAKTPGDQGHPRIYIQILVTLADLYRSQHQYLAAFEMKQAQLSIEQQYGFRAFIGAVRLQPYRVETTAPTSCGHQGTIAPEIIASGRQRDLERLLERIGRPDHKLTILHGLSGVGKSSLVNGALIPALRHKPIGTLDNLPIAIQTYGDWLAELERCFDQAIAQSHRSPLAPGSPFSGTAFSDRLRQCETQNLRPVLIFDQFEEFFFTHPDPTEQQQFFQFLGDCLNVLPVKVVLSLREDYLHYLLAANDLPSLAIVNQDILSKQVLYRVGNLSAADGRSLIEAMTARSNYYLEPALITALVEDLAGITGSIRPIELQVVGTQLQTEQIQTLAAYQTAGQKTALVKRYLAEIVADCGPAQEPIANLLLYSLTDEKGTRPLKTRTELERDLESFHLQAEQVADQLDLILTIFVRSRLVVLLPETPADRYQLVHDYLATLIRQQQEPRFKQLQAELEQERQKSRISDAKLNRFLRWALVSSLAAMLGLTGFTLLAISTANRANRDRQRAEISEIEALNSYSVVLVNTNQRFAALRQSLKALQQLRQAPWADADIRLRTAATLNQALYGLQERNTLEGHQAVVNGVSFSPDSQTLATVSDDKTVKLWNRTGKLLQTLAGHQARVNSVSFSPDAQTIATASDDQTVKLWSRSGQLLQTLTGHQARVNSVSFSRNVSILATVSENGVVQLWARQGKLFRLLRTFPSHQVRVNSVSFSPDAQTIATASDDQTVKLWNRTGKLLQTLTGHQARVNSVSFSPNAQTLATGSRDGIVKLWIRQGKRFQADLTFKGHQNAITDVQFSQDGKTIATASQDGLVKLWSRSGQLLQTFKSHYSSVTGISFSRDGQLLATASRDGTAKLWSLTGTKLQIFQGHQTTVWSVEFSPDGTMLATASRDGTAKLWKRSGQRLHVFQGHTGEVNSVSFSRDSQLLATASDDRTVKVWRVSGQLLQTLPAHPQPVIKAQFSPIEPMLLAVSGRIVKLWNQTGQGLQVFQGHEGEVADARFSQDGQTIAIASGNTVKLWRPSGQALGTLKGHQNRVFRVTFSPDGQHLATASVGNMVKLWSRSGQILQVLQGHENTVFGISFSPDGQNLATASKDGTVKLWSRSGQVLQTFQANGGELSSISWSADGYTLAAASQNGRVILWELNPDELVRQSCDWLHDYLITHPQVLSELTLCQTPEFTKSSK